MNCLHKAAEKDAVIVVDATRFSSTIVVALACGIEKIIPIDKPENYLEYISGRSKDILAFKDDEARKVDYADVGHSPKDCSISPISSKLFIV